MKKGRSKSTDTAKPVKIMEEFTAKFIYPPIEKISATDYLLSYKSNNTEVQIKLGLDGKADKIKTTFQNALEDIYKKQNATIDDYKSDLDSLKTQSQNVIISLDGVLSQLSAIAFLKIGQPTGIDQNTLDGAPKTLASTSKATVNDNIIKVIDEEVYGKTLTYEELFRKITTSLHNVAALQTDYNNTIKDIYTAAYKSAAQVTGGSNFFICKDGNIEDIGSSITSDYEQLQSNGSDADTDTLTPLCAAAYALQTHDESIKQALQDGSAFDQTAQTLKSNVEQDSKQPNIDFVQVALSGPYIISIIAPIVFAETSAQSTDGTDIDLDSNIDTAAIQDALLDALLEVISA